MKLALTQIILGILIAASSLYISWHVMQTKFTFQVPGDSGQTVTVFGNPAVEHTLTYWTAIVTFILGLAVLGCGAAQFLKSRKSK